MSPGTRLVLVSALLFGTTGTAQALGPTGADPLAVGLLRVVVGAAGLAAVSRTNALRDLRTNGRWAVMAAAGVAGYQVSFFAAVRASGVGVGTVVTIGSAPVLTAVVAWAVSRSTPARAWYPATALAVAGIALLTRTEGASGLGGVGLALAAGASYAVFSVGAERLVARLGATRAMAASFVGGAVLLSPLLVIADLGFVRSPSGMLVVLWLGLVTTTAAYLFYGRGLATTPATTVATLVLAEPVTAAVLSVLVVGEAVTTTGVLGAVLVLAGLAILGRRSPDDPASFTLSP